MRRILLDENLPRGLAVSIRQLGIDCDHVQDLGFSSTEDNVILDWADQNKVVVMTKDADFVNLHTVRGIGRVCLVRIGNRSRADTIQAIVSHGNIIIDFLESDDSVLILSFS